jgi:predicted TIM-barrel fold metal-dependent hydrolase
MSGYIDAHVHVWGPVSKEFPDDPAVGRPSWMHFDKFEPHDILNLAQPSGVNRVVLIQMTNYGTDNAYMCDAIAKHPGVFSGVAIIDHTAPPPEVAAEIRRLKQLGVRGFRIIQVGDKLDPYWLEHPGYQSMFKIAGEEGMAMCPLIEPAMIPSVSESCARFTDTAVVVDHFARIGGDGVFREKDVRALCDLAKHPRAYVKASAFYAFGRKQPPHDDLVPTIRAVCDAFGPQRVMWASDCPFQLLKESYEDSISLVRDRLEFLSREDKEWMLRRAAESVFFT